MAKTPNPDIQQFNVRMSAAEMQELQEIIAVLRAANIEAGIAVRLAAEPEQTRIPLAQLVIEKRQHTHH